MKGIFFTIAFFTFPLFLPGCVHNTAEDRLQEFITTHVAQVESITTHANLTYWKASTTGNRQDYDKLRQLQIEIRQIHSDPQEYALIKDLRGSGEIEDPRLRRQLDKLYYQYLRNQIEPNLLKRMVALDTKIQQRYSSFRGTMEGREVTNSDIYTILTTETDSRTRELAWKASKQVGEAIVDDFLQLVRLCNGS